MDEIKVTVVEPSGERTELTAPTDMGLSLMEFLKASEYPIQATCGGMALCATCHVEVLDGPELREPSDDEAYMLESLPTSTSRSRLSCQIKLSEEIDGIVVRIAAED
ncbi:2Fe-2S iron-sulfur cluster-binding protein [Adhaeribacter soli]|uniref:2Fe-2S iron-sulfur cluster binding domain-containing protein n=1 Tax=Adhaeribacter soli TaxID=2607655 RepID=A0A5N1J471_9BACT|nr:2Fe-2S iron-sulfur cluster-binding protein [Adhaeribacter soli]KAA9345706.1 2Fe-2S iron-sulfur cluster binding domain-containing protein [Adhaeribacter soli]